MNVYELQAELEALRTELAAAREQLRAHDALLGTIMTGGMVEMSTSTLKRHPGTQLTERIRTERRIVISSDRVLVERQQVEKIGSALEGVIRYAEQAEKKAEGAYALAADLTCALRQLGLSVTIENGRAKVVRECDLPKSVAEARKALEALAQDAANRLEQAGIRRHHAGAHRGGRTHAVGGARDSEPLHQRTARILAC